MIVAFRGVKWICRKLALLLVHGAHSENHILNQVLAAHHDTSNDGCSLTPRVGIASDNIVKEIRDERLEMRARCSVSKHISHLDG